MAEIIDALLGVRADPYPTPRRFIASADSFVFSVTKRIHHRLHGHPRGELPDPAEHAAYVCWAEQNAERLTRQASRSDLIVLHDPQTLPMAPLLLNAGFRVAWRCHIGTSSANATSRSTWLYLSQFWAKELILVFSDPALVPDEAAGHQREIIQPSIDPNALKNIPLSDAAVRDILASTELPQDGDPVILQVSRWDPLKDMVGVLQAFSDSALPRAARLVLCGPSPNSIVDDPEAATVLAEVMRCREELPRAVARRVHLVCPVLADTVGNAKLINALQRRATVVTQKSLQEGFGLTITEAMWKSRPVVASRVGGIPSQITHNQTGLLVDDPHDRSEFVRLVIRLLDRPDQAVALGRAAARWVAERFTVTREAADHQRLYRQLAQSGRCSGG